MMKRIICMLLALILGLSLLSVSVTASTWSGVLTGSQEEGGEEGEECDHEWEQVDTATCEEAGTISIVCKKCGEVGASKDSAAKGHQSEEWLHDEKEHWRVCTVCEKEYNRAEHAWEEGWQHDTKTHWRICSVCGAKGQEASHTWDGGKVTKQATCVQKGVKTYTCTVCKATKTAEIPMTQHSWDGGKTTKKPTITEKGESLFKCTVCGKEATREIDPLGLTMSPEELTTIVNGRNNVLDLRLDDETWAVMQATLNAEELERIQGGWPVTITMEAVDAAAQVDAAAKRSAEELAEGGEVFAYFRMDLTKQMQDDPSIQVERTIGPVIVALTPPEDLPKQSKWCTRVYHAYCVDGGQVEYIATQYDEETDTIRFQTESFGTYAMAYVDLRDGGVGIIVVYIVVGVLTLGGIGFLVKKAFFTKDDDEEWNENGETFSDMDEEDDGKSWVSKLLMRLKKVPVKAEENSKE